jgi:hypothetical protein
VFPRPPEELRKMSRPKVLEAFPDLLAILDATNWEQFTPQNFLANRLSYSAYKHMNVFQVLLGELEDPFRVGIVEKLRSFSRFDRKTDSVSIGNLRRHFE